MNLNSHWAYLVSIESPSVVSFPPEPTTTMPTIYSDGPGYFYDLPRYTCKKVGNKWIQQNFECRTEKQHHLTYWLVRKTVIHLKIHAELSELKTQWCHNLPVKFFVTFVLDTIHLTIIWHAKTWLTYHIIDIWPEQTTKVISRFLRHLSRHVVNRANQYTRPRETTIKHHTN